MMRTRVDLCGIKRGVGFTLVELLLTVAILCLLSGALVYNFAHAQRGAALEEGATQMEALIRYARAYSSSSGKNVQLAFEEEPSADLMFWSASPKLLWESNPFQLAGQFQEVMEAQSYVKELNNWVSIEEVKPVGQKSISTNSLEKSESQMELYPAVHFFPDGSSDSAEIILSSRDPEDRRKLSIVLSGTIGLTKRKWIQAPVAGDKNASEEEDWFP